MKRFNTPGYLLSRRVPWHSSQTTKCFAPNLSLAEPKHWGRLGSAD